MNNVAYTLFLPKMYRRTPENTGKCILNFCLKPNIAGFLDTSAKIITFLNKYTQS